LFVIFADDTIRSALSRFERACRATLSTICRCIQYVGLLLCCQLATLRQRLLLLLLLLLHRLKITLQWTAKPGDGNK